MKNNIILTGPPRSGTTLTCFLLNKVRNVVALHEPMDLKMFPNPREGVENIHRFFKRMRHSALEQGKVISKVKAGKIPDNPFGKRWWGKRKSLIQKKEIDINKPLGPDFKLAIKHNGHFSFLLNELSLQYPSYATIRNPLSCIASWNSIQAPVAKGNLKVLKGLNPQIYQALENIPNLIDRQIHLMHLLFQTYQVLSEAQIIRYEDIIATGGKVLAAIVPEAIELNEPLENKNKNKIYDAKLIQKIGERLLQSSGTYWNYYARSDVETLLK